MLPFFAAHDISDLSPFTFSLKQTAPLKSIVGMGSGLISRAFTVSFLGKGNPQQNHPAQFSRPEPRNHPGPEKEKIIFQTFIFLGSNVNFQGWKKKKSRGEHLQKHPTVSDLGSVTYRHLQEISPHLSGALLSRCHALQCLDGGGELKKETKISLERLEIFQGTFDGMKSY